MTSAKELITSPDDMKKDLSKTDSHPATSIHNVFIRAVKYICLEVVVFLYMSSYIMKSVSIMTMIIDKVCRIKLNLSDHICNNLTEYHDEKDQVETLANNYHLYHSLIEMVPAALLATFIGPWSDTYGRIFPICLSFIGVAIDGIGITLISYFRDSEVEYYLICPVFASLSGGIIGLFTVVYSYLSDVTTPENRTFKFASMEVSMGLGIPIGSVVGNVIYKYYGMTVLFGASVLGQAVGLLWVLVMVEETRDKSNNDPWRVKIRNFFDLKRFLESFRACIKPRPHKGRTQIWLLLFSMSFAILSLAGTATIGYIFVYHHFNWSNPKYSLVSAMFTVFGLVVMLISVPILTKCLKLGDPTLGILGSLSGVSRNIVISLASKPGVYFLGNLLGLFAGLSTLAGRTRISKIISSSETGKVFAFLSTIESIAPILATSAITPLFNATKDFYPDASYMGVGVVSFFPLAVYVWLAFLPDVNYEEIYENEKLQNENLKNNIPDVC